MELDVGCTGLVRKLPCRTGRRPVGRRLRTPWCQCCGSWGRPAGSWPGTWPHGHVAFA